MGHCSGSGQRGFAVLDMLMKLGFVLALLVIIMMVAKLIQSRVTSISSTTSLTTLAEGIRNVFGKTGNFNNLDDSAIIAANIVDQTMVQGGKLMSEWNTQISVAPYSLNGGGNDGFSIAYTVPKEDCAQFVSSGEAVFSQVKVNNVAVKDTINGTPFSGVDTAKNCSGLNSVPVMFIGGRR